LRYATADLSHYLAKLRSWLPITQHYGHLVQTSMVLHCIVWESCF